MIATFYSSTIEKSKNEDLCMKNESVSQILNPLGSNESENQTWGMMHILLALI